MRGVGALYSGEEGPRMKDEAMDEGAVTAPDEVRITDALTRRRAHAPDHEAEARTLGALARDLATDPRGSLQKIADAAMLLCRADSAAVGIIESDGDAATFRWHAVAGASPPSLTDRIPIGETPVGIALRSGAVELFERIDHRPVRRDSAPPGSDVDRRAAQLRGLTDTLGRELHALAVRLRPRALDDFGLEAALQSYAEEWARQSGIAIDVHARGPNTRLLPSAESAVYRIVQEALTNVARHSGAAHAGVVLERRDGYIHVVVEDDGRGFDPERVAMPDADRIQRLGLVGMRERAALVGGTMDIESAPGKGTTLFVRFPGAGGTLRLPGGLLAHHL